MRLPRLRLTLRRMMLLVLVLGVGLHLGLTARRVYRASGRHVHRAIGENANGALPSWCLMIRRNPFWPSYCRALVGLSWKDWPLGRPLCRAEPGLLLERCELAHPDIRGHPGTDTFSARVTKEQAELYVQLVRKRGRIINVDYDKDGNPTFHIRSGMAKR